MIDSTRMFLKLNAWLALATLILTSWPASAATVYGVRVQEQGVYECQTLNSYKPSETGGNNRNVSECRVTKATQYVTARIGSDYGCFYEIVGSPDGADVQMEHRIVIPNPGAINPTTGEHFLVYTSYANYTIGRSHRLIGWHPDHAGELVAGDWTMEIRYQGRLLASCVFHVST